eukprot:GDKJ01019572.1.p1 GENE.GDKJ01019572.1~~GDKJ01019572.1.p1  ORF type:complete len:184 (-),score=13.59 GDKJ01019572.1:89-559(-)
MKSGLGFVLVYSITDSESFHQLKKIYAHLRRTKGESTNLPCIVVANKTDLSAQRAVSAEEGMLFAQQASAPFVETTAKDRHQVEEVFATLVRSIHQTQTGMPSDASAAKVEGNTTNGATGAVPAHGAESNTGAADTPTAAPAPKPKEKKKGRCNLL